MKQNKIVNINVKVRLSRKPSRKEKMTLVRFIADALDSASVNFYHSNLGDKTPLAVDHHYVTVRKMGRVF